MIKRIIIWAVVIFVIFEVSTEPSGAAGFVAGVNSALHSAATSFASFVQSI